jgi:hypothetical protein
MVDDEDCTLGLIGKVLGSQRHVKHEIVRLRIFDGTKEKQQPVMICM